MALRVHSATPPTRRKGFVRTAFILSAQDSEVMEINQRTGGAMIGEAVCRSLRANVYDAMIAMTQETRQQDMVVRVTRCRSPRRSSEVDEPRLSGNSVSDDSPRAGAMAG